MKSVLPIKLVSTHLTFGLLIYNYFPEDTTVAVLFMGMVSINYWNLINVFREVWQQVSTLCSRLRGGLLKDPGFWSKNIDIHWENPYLYVLTSVCGYIP
jgi:hypothetical protein